ncbi:MAG: hypothetical protein M1828_004194 [Chrysothrix sp. TS-e1954]|nr:MAG: hypothetical protein M1828_004194 [Chrysothrix sp. TS-e1954]
MAATAVPKTGARPSSGVRSPSSASSSNNTQPGARQRGPAASNGVNGRPRSQNEGASSSQEAQRTANTSDHSGHDRLILIMATMVGCLVKVTLKSGDQYSGIFSGASLDSTEQRYTLKMTKKVSVASNAQTNGATDAFDDYVGYGEDHVKTFDISDVADLNAPNVAADRLPAKLANGTSGVRTDAEISARFKNRERELQPWQNPGDALPNMSLNGGGGGNAKWDQFETNERLTGLGTDYDENLYTTTIDRSQPSYKRRAADADRKAREIEGSATNNPHVAEERNIAHGEAEIDEESNGVKRDFPPLTASHANRYMPPARRAPTGQTTVAGAPVDPAIISSSFVKPNVSSANQSPEATPADQETAPPQKENTVPPQDPKPATPAQSTAIPSSENTDADKQVAQAPVKDTKAVVTPLNLSQKSAYMSNRPAAMATTNATATVERDVLKSFKDFAGTEKIRMQERLRTHAKREKDVKLNDLKKFSENFTLKSKVPTDMLGILAKDKKRQEEIVEKSERQRAENSPKKAVGPSNDQSTMQATTSQRAEDAAKTMTTFPERQHARGGRSGHGSRNFSAEQGFQTSGRPAPGTLGQRLLQQPQYAPGSKMVIQPLPSDMQMPGHKPTPVRTDMAHRGNGMPPLTSPMSAFNAKASEFKPNPSASAFSPNLGPPSPAKRAPSSQQRSPKRGSFFGDKRPQKTDKVSIDDGFNPIVRMKKEVDAEKKNKEFAANGGIPQAYRTGPTWDTPEHNKDKSYTDVFDKAPVVIANGTGSGAMPHQHQLPLHLQSGMSGYPAPHSQQPRPGYPQFHGHNRDHQYDEHRMQHSNSNSSYMPSPRFHQGSPMMHPVGPMQGMHGQQYMMPPGQPMMYRPVPNGQQTMNPQAMGGPMMFHPQGGSPYMGVPMHQPIQFSPAPGHAYPMHGGHQQPPNYPSPSRGPVMMVPQGSQQGQAPFMHMSNSQQGYPMYQPPQQPPMMSRGNSYMSGQQQYGYNSGLPQQHPRAQPYGSNYNQQHMPGPQMAPQGQQAAPLMNNHNEVDEGK